MRISNCLVLGLLVVGNLCAGRAAQGADGAGGPVLPAEAMVAAKTRVLPPESPDLALAPLTASVRVEWGKVLREVPDAIWSVNDYELLDPKLAGDAGFNRAMEEIAPPYVRVHQGGMPSQWLDAEQKHWDVAKIKACWAAASGYAGRKVMFNIAGWPGWMNDAQGCLKPECEQEYARLYVELMRIMRDEVKRPIEYWEITNEVDGKYGKAKRLDDLWRVYNTVAMAMKAEDPAAKVGGVAFTWANPAWVDGFATHCLKNADFVTYHNYGTGDMYDSNEVLFGKLAGFEKTARYMREVVDKNAAGRHIPIFLDEYNVKWVWTPVERRHGNNVGAAFQAGVINHVLKGGIDGAFVWHLKGHSYGIIEADNQRRATAPLFVWGPRFLVGKMASVAVDVEGLEVLAVEKGDGARSVLIANTLPRGVKIDGTALGLGSAVQMRQVNAAGNSEGAAAAQMELPGYSLTLLTGAGK